jgi:ComF family protein
VKINFAIANTLKDALFPTKCFMCGTFFKPGSYQIGCLPFREPREKTFSIQYGNIHFDGLMSPYLCPNCSGGFLPVEPPICIKCGMTFKSREGEDHLCGECITTPKRFRIARAPGIYDQALMEMIHYLKYNGKIQLAGPLGALLCTSFISQWDTNTIDLIVPVPLHIKRFRSRGFNQSFLLIKDWLRIAEVLNVNISHVQIDKHVLVRNRWTDPQTGLGRKKRILNIKNAFNITDPKKVAGKRILLVDDVYTTGTTVNECAKVLLKSGAQYVDVLTLARAI